MVEGIESIVVGQRYVGVVLDEKCQHIVAFFGNGIVQRRVTLGILQSSNTKNKINK